MDERAIFQAQEFEMDGVDCRVRKRTRRFCLRHRPSSVYGGAAEKGR